MGVGSKLSGLAKQVGTAFGNVIAPGSIAATQIADGSVTTPKIANGALSADATGRAKMANGFVTDAQVATANKDGASATASLRTLGTGAAQACAGNDARLSDTRTPTDGSVTAPKLAQMSATTGQVLTWGGSAWAPATPSVTNKWPIRIQAKGTADTLNENAGLADLFYGPACEGADTTEANVSLVVAKALTVLGLYVYVTANTWTQTGTLEVRKNGAAVLTLNVTAGLTGALSITGSVAFAAGDALSIRLHPPATGGGTTTFKSLILEVA